MPELNNTEFDLNVRIQKQLHDNTHEKVKNHQALNDDEIKYLCPVAFKRRMVKSEIDKLGLSKQNARFPMENEVSCIIQEDFGYS